MSYNGQTVAAMRGRTSARSRWMFPGASMSPDSGAFPFYIWSLADLSATYLPSLFAGVTENTGWDGNKYDFWYAETGNRVDYRNVSAEDIATESPGHFDAVTCMEMLEHVPDPSSTVAACATLVKPGGDVFFSTINRNLKAYLFAIVGAEYVLRMLPRGTHDYAKFIKPSELSRLCRNAGLELRDVTGMSYNPLTKIYSLGDDTSVNYILHCVKA